MDERSNKSVEKSQELQNPDRRRLLKLLAAGGTVATVSLLPGKWSSPVVKSGVLPAHAQVTPGQYIVQCSQGYEELFDEGFKGYVLEATATDTVLNQPVGGVQLTATITIGQFVESVTSGTSAQGLATFTIWVPDNLTASGATVKFTDQQTYGTDSCTIQFRIPS